MPRSHEVDDLFGTHTIAVAISWAVCNCSPASACCRWWRNHSLFNRWACPESTGAFHHVGHGFDGWMRHPGPVVVTGPTVAAVGDSAVQSVVRSDSQDQYVIQIGPGLGVLK